MTQYNIERILSHSGWVDLRNITHHAKRILDNFRNRLLAWNKLRKVGGSGFLINLGCGEIVREGWLNIDMSKGRGIYYHDLRNLLPMSNECARHINCEHFLEHLEYHYAKKLLTECYRLLEEGGKLRLIVPDAEKYLYAYCQKDTVFFEKLKTLGGMPQPFRTKMEIINQMFRMYGDHKFAWDFETLELALREAGFTRIEQSEIGEIEAEYNIDGTDSWRPVESLYVNATK